MASEAWDDRCRKIVLGVLTKRGWQLVQDDKAFADEVGSEVRLRHLKNAAEERAAIERVAFRHYCVILHSACGGSGSRRQRRAFEELWNYLYPIAVYRIHDADRAQDFAQQAIEKVWKKLPQCREPGSFLSWATLILINEIRESYRGQKGREKALGEPGGDEPEITESDLHAEDEEEDSEINPLGSVPGDEGLENLVRNEEDQELRALIAKCIKNRQQQRIMVELFLNDKGYKEIAEELHISVDNVHVARHRALKALRKCGDWKRFLEDRLK